MRKKVLIASAILICLLIAISLRYSNIRYNVILITVDTLRADYLSCYNPAAAVTSNINRLAAKGVLFTKAFSLIPITMPSHTAILSSHPPIDLSLFNNGDTYYGKWPLVSDFLAREGYQTAAFVSLGVLKGRFGLKNHFNRYEDNFANSNGRNYKVASEINVLALPWIEKQRKNHFFAWIHYSDPHEPYVTVDAPADTEIRINDIQFGKYCFRKRESVTVNFMALPGDNKVEFNAIATPKLRHQYPGRFLESKITLVPTHDVELSYGPEWKEYSLPNGIAAHYFNGSGVLKIKNTKAIPIAVTLRFSAGVRGQNIADVRNNYAAEVQYVDKHIGELWDKLTDLGLNNTTIIVFTADHGEGLKTHEYVNHINCLYNETIRIPLIIYYPNLGYRGKKEDHLVDHLDVAPTILDLLHIQAFEMRGRTLKGYVSFSPLDQFSRTKTDLLQTYSATYSPQASSNSFSLIEGDIKLIYVPEKKHQWEVYHLAEDPRELRDLVKFDLQELSSTKIRNMQQSLLRYQTQAEMAHKSHQQPKMDEEQKEILKALGYIN